MATVKLKYPTESFDSLYRRWKKAVDNDDIVKCYRKNEFFEKVSEKRKRAKAAAKKRSEKIISENMIMKRKY